MVPAGALRRASGQADSHFSPKIKRRRQTWYHALVDEDRNLSIRIEPPRPRGERTRHHGINAFQRHPFLITVFAITTACVTTHKPVYHAADLHPEQAHATRTCFYHYLIQVRTGGTASRGGGLRGLLLQEQGRRISDPSSLFLFACHAFSVRCRLQRKKLPLTEEPVRIFRAVFAVQAKRKAERVVSRHVPTADSGRADAFVRPLLQAGMRA